MDEILLFVHENEEVYEGNIVNGLESLDYME